MSLNTGTDCKRGLSIMEIKKKDIIEIIKCCSGRGVVSFEYGGLKIGFSPTPLNFQSGPPISQTELDAQKELESDLVRQENLDRMRIEDPLAFEQAMALGDE